MKPSNAAAEALGVAAVLTGIIIAFGIPWVVGLFTIMERVMNG